MKEKQKTKLSVIIPTYNEEKDISECIKSLEEQTYKNIEIILVDDGSTDNTRGVIKSFKNVKLINGQHKGPGFSRNLGVKSSRGEVLIFVDADMSFQKDYLENLVKPILEDKEIIGTTHDSEIVKNTDNIWSKCWGRVRVSKENAHEVKIFRAIRKDDFLEFGGFNPEYGYADDQTFWFKFKAKPRVAENTVCYHKNPETLKGVYRQSRWIGASIDAFNIPLLKYIIPIIGLFLSPILVILLSIKRCYKLRNFNIFPSMIIFITARYFGTIQGMVRRFYFSKNFR